LGDHLDFFIGNFDLGGVKFVLVAIVVVDVVLVVLVVAISYVLLFPFNDYHLSSC